MASIGHKRLWHLSFGQHAVMHDQDTKMVYGDPANPLIFFSEEFHKTERTVDELAFLASHIIVAGAKYNAMIDGLDLIVWREGTDKLEPLNDAALEVRSKQFTADLDDLVLKAMRS